VWFDGCNNCSVFDGKIGACTRKFCSTYEEPKCLDKEEEKPTIPENCGIWFDGCNTCNIFEGQIDACTRESCSVYQKPKCLHKTREPVPVEVAEPPKDCLTWFDGCNRCKVLEDGRLVCTEMFCYMKSEPKCLEFKEPVKPAIPENCTVWFDGCNNCLVSGGEIGACTRKFCSTYKEPKCLDKEEEPEENT